jgi:hypothetical protein
LPPVTADGSGAFNCKLHFIVFRGANKQQRIGGNLVVSKPAVNRYLSGITDFICGSNDGHEVVYLSF